MFDLAAATVHRFCGPSDRTAKRLNNRLVSQTNAQDRFAGFKLLDHLEANAGLVWVARSWREHDGSGVETLDLFHGYRIVANDVRLATQLAKIPREVVDEGVVIVDD